MGRLGRTAVLLAAVALLGAVRTHAAITITGTAAPVGQSYVTLLFTSDDSAGDGTTYTAYCTPLGGSSKYLGPAPGPATLGLPSAAGLSHIPRSTLGFPDSLP